MKNATASVPLKHLSKFCRSLEMPLINCKVKLKLRWSKHCVLSVGGTDNVNGNNDNKNFIFTIKDTKLCSCSNFINKKQSKTIKTS